MPDPHRPLDAIEIRRPCSVPWETMAGDDRVRFCDHCRLKVFNLSALTRPEAENLVGRAEGRLCVQFYRRADGTVLTADCSLRERVTRRVSAFVSAALALLGIGSSLFGCAPAQAGGLCLTPPEREKAGRPDRDKDERDKKDRDATPEDDGMQD